MDGNQFVITKTRRKVSVKSNLFRMNISYVDDTA
jgi:hypothetical protein